MTKVRKITITVTKHFDDDTITTTTYEFVNGYIDWERGIRKHYYEDECRHIEANGYRRIMIKAWDKGESWDDFIKEEKVEDIMPTVEKEKLNDH